MPQSKPLQTPYSETAHLHQRALGNWAATCATYRSAVESYQRALRIKDHRARVQPAPRPRPVKPQPAEVPTAGGSVPRLPGLSARECEVAQLIGQGWTNQQIADALVITLGTAANHVAHILQKLGASNRTQVAAQVLTMRQSVAD